jgi:GEVED domain
VAIDSLGTGVVTSATNSVIGYFNSITNSYVPLVNYTGGNNINAIATQPSTGNLFFVNRATGRTIVYNPNTGTQTTLTGILPTPTTIIGATFNASGSLYIYYTNKTLIEVDPSNGSQVGSIITINGIPGGAPSTGIPGTTPVGTTLTGGTTNGDIAIGTDGVIRILGDTGVTLVTATTVTYTSRLYTLTISGTTATATPVVASNISGLNGSAANGLAIDPASGNFYISSSLGTYELNPTTNTAVQLTNATGTNDLAACGSPAPDLPSITKAFNPNNVVGIPANSTLTLTLGNTNQVPIYLISTLVDNFQTGLAVRSPNGLGGTCLADTANNNKITAVANSNSISLLNGLKVPTGGCTVTVNVTASNTGTFINTIAAGELKTTAGNNPSDTTGTLTVVPSDYGDAPITGTAPSGTGTNAYGQAIHGVISGIRLGAAIDAETTSIANATASGDGTDDDGVTFVGGTTLNTGATASVSVVTSGTGVLHAWIDFNGNGTFESSERITNWVGGNSSTGGTTTLTFGVPEGFTGNTYARFRYSSDVAAANPSGSANDGEVEDYQITLAPRLTPATYTNGTPVRKGICSIYSATGADQVVTAPTGARGLTIKLWGAGGGHEIVGTGYAGAGGYTDAQFGSSVVTPGAQFTLVVGRGGVSGGRPNEFSPTAVYGFGAVAGHEQGGGLAGLFTGSATVLETDRARALAIAGGGGGYEHSGGIGTGTTGGNGNSPSSGGQSTMRGSTDNLTRTSNSNVIMTAHISSGGGGYQGGGRLPAPNPYSAVTGGDLANIAAASGGSGFVAGTATAGRILSTTDGIGTPPNTSDSDYLTGIGTAGTLSANPGGNARAVLCWDVSDYGDAPATYDVGTPASHLLSSSPSVYLGATPPDGESAAQPNVAANGDNTNDTSDEDAFTTLPNVPTTSSYSLNNIPVKNTSVTAATLNAWIDFNKDGVFQASEYTSVSIPANATTANLDWASVPAGTTAGSTYARFRITTDALSDNTATTEDERSFGSASDGEVEDYAITIGAASKAKLILVKRITAIKDGVTGAITNYAGSVADLNLIDLANYSNCNWPTATGTAGACTNTYLAGVMTTTAPKVKPGDEIEYTIYYLNAGENKATARVCDRLHPNLTFQPDFDASNTGKGIGFKPGTTGITYLTNIGTDNDKGQLTDASISSCNLPNNAGTQVIAVDVGDATTPLLGSTGAGTPTSSYGYIRFKTTVN